MCMCVMPGEDWPTEIFTWHLKYPCRRPPCVCSVRPKDTWSNCSGVYASGDVTIKHGNVWLWIIKCIMGYLWCWCYYNIFKLCRILPTYNLFITVSYRVIYIFRFAEQRKTFKLNTDIVFFIIYEAVREAVGAEDVLRCCD